MLLENAENKLKRSEASAASNKQSLGMKRQTLF